MSTSDMSIIEGAILPNLLGNPQVLAELFEKTVLAHPQNLCMKNSLGKIYTYEEVEHISSVMAYNLYSPSQYALSPGESIVALWQPRGIPLLLSQIAIAKSGAAWLPFDFDAPVSRISLCMNDAKVRIIITSKEGKAMLQSYREQPALPSQLIITTPEQLQEVLVTSSGYSDYISPRSRGLTADHPAYFIYTSGSTGTPKGITITQKNAVHYLQAINTIYGAHAGDIMLQTASVAFDLSVEEIWLLLTVGGMLYVAAPEEVIDIESLPALLQRENISMIDTVPTLLAMISSTVSSSSSSDPFPSLRIVIVGGEALTQSVLVHWSAPGRSIYNTYGPTETTIVATTWLAQLGRDITIGVPIGNYIAYVVDPDTLKVLPRGVQGELLIGGVGVAQGYYKRADLTASKFIPNPFVAAGSREAIAFPILYRSGDACALTAGPAAELLFHGRIDDQVKVRGFRVELGEIESHIDRLGAAFGIKRGQVAVVLKAASEGASECLVAFIVLDSSSTAQMDVSNPLHNCLKIDSRALSQALRVVMPAYMVPSSFQELTVLPRLAASGKIDRNALKALAKNLQDRSEQNEEENDATAATADANASSVEQLLRATAAKVFKMKRIALDADFFNDLGGHSLAVSQFISSLRLAHPNTALSGISFLDLYASRTIRKLAALVDARVSSASVCSGEQTVPVKKEYAGTPTNGRFPPPPWQRRYLCGLCQAMCLPFILLLGTIKWLGLFLAADLSIRLQCPHKVFRSAQTHVEDDYADDYETMEKCQYSSRLTIMTVTVTFIGIYLAIKLLVIALKWMILGRAKAGRYPMWGVYYFRCWLTANILAASEVDIFYGSPLITWYYRALGAKIGENCTIHSLDGHVPDMLDIHDDVSIGHRVMFETTTVTGDEFIVGKVSIGTSATIGTLSVLGRDTVIGQGAVINALTSIPDGTTIPPMQEWDGSPVSFVKHVAPNNVKVSAHLGHSTAAKVAEGSLFLLMYFVLLVMSVAPVFPAFFFLTNTQMDLYNNSEDDVINETMLITPNSYNASWPVLLILIWPTSAICLLLTLALALITRWTLFPCRLKPGTYNTHSFMYYRLWFLSNVINLCLSAVQTMYATLWMTAWYKSMGAGLSWNTEVSTKLEYFDLINLGEHSFVADDAVLGEDKVSYGWLEIGGVRAGSKAFFGNDCVAPFNSTLGSNVLLGVKSIMPRSKTVMNNEIHFGSPSIPLPNKQIIDLGAAGLQVEAQSQLTYSPSWTRWLLRGAFEFFILPIPLLILIFFGYVGADYIAQFYIDNQWGYAIMVGLFTGPAISVSALVLMLAIKWGWMGVYKPGKHFMWSWWAIRNEAFQHVFLGTAGAFLLGYLKGTPMLPAFLRLFGMKIGHGCYIASIDIPEFDCVEVGNYCVINNFVGIQTHLFEDRIMKIGAIKIGDFVNLGMGSTVLYDTVIKSGACIGPQSCVMKGESIDGNSYCIGIPTRSTAATSGKTAVSKNVAPLPVSGGIAAREKDSRINIELVPSMIGTVPRRLEAGAHTYSLRDDIPKATV